MILNDEWVVNLRPPKEKDLKSMKGAMFSLEEKKIMLRDIEDELEVEERAINRNQSQIIYYAKVLDDQLENFGQKKNIAKKLRKSIKEDNEKEDEL